MCACVCVRMCVRARALGGSRLGARPACPPGQQAGANEQSAGALLAAVASGASVCRAYTMSLSLPALGHHIRLVITSAGPARPLPAPAVLQQSPPRRCFSFLSVNYGMITK